MNDKNEYLIQKRADHLKLLPGIWAAASGAAIKGEESKTAAIREVKEELGIKPCANKMKKIKRIKGRGQ
ncbi:MAG: NUDIX domain-containing protein [Halanaerobiales bacterium]|nr:NUDIX domain-containing protein [Halanaerobiales bacterium]